MSHTVPHRVLVGIDPGPTTSGLVVYQLEPDGSGRVIRSQKDATLGDLRGVLDLVVRCAVAVGEVHEVEVEVVFERTQAGPPSTSVVKTTEVVGRLMEACEARRLPWTAYYRRQVLQALGCARQGNKDALVRAACIELHGGHKEVAIGKKASPGPLYGLSSHAWQALGVVCAHLLTRPSETAQ